MKEILVTGASGLCGHYCCKLLLEKDSVIQGFDMIRQLENSGDNETFRKFKIFKL